MTQDLRFRRLESGLEESRGEAPAEPGSGAASLEEGRGTGRHLEAEVSSLMTLYELVYDQRPVTGCMFTEVELLRSGAGDVDLLSEALAFHDPDPLLPSHPWVPLPGLPRRLPKEKAGAQGGGRERAWSLWGRASWVPSGDLPRVPASRSAVRVAART